MEDITNSFEKYFYPSCALVFYQSEKGYNDTYIEYNDIDRNGSPINAHPLTLLEAKKLAESLYTDEEKGRLLKSDGLLPSNILSFDAQKAKIIWFTKAQKRQLYFSENLGIVSGRAYVPAMIWKADREALSVFALSSDRRPTTNSGIYHAPFFNIYQSGNVCLGTVDIQLREINTVTAFTNLWESYFFNSYFTHLMSGHNPVDGNCVVLWNDLVDSDKEFPCDKLIKTNQKLKDILL
ncbi:PRTRC system protein B [Sphingobacterium sp. Ag1]|uniref:PRTRC system protein B n=1 Tax=Sphingobacterium sp. Ag1 TaxID=1643451 RepID=UPI0006278024|nr:PRTRC system protein B [Sphingobacterium sp. Ag1]KKO89184.1 PRTRC system protein B [Sphingobacterium sp. Ag1]